MSTPELPSVILPIVDVESFRDLIISRRIRPRPFPRQISIDAYLGMERFHYDQRSDSFTLLNQVDFKDDISLVIGGTEEPSSMYKSGDRTSNVTVHKGNYIVGTLAHLVHYEPHPVYPEGDIETITWATDFNETALRQFRPYLEALDIYAALRPGVVPSKYCNQIPQKQLGWSAIKAFEICRELESGTPKTDKLQRIDLPKLQGANTANVLYEHML